MISVNSPGCRICLKSARATASFGCPLLAQSGHRLVRCTCPLLGIKRTCHFALQMSAFDPKRVCCVESRDNPIKS